MISLSIYYTTPFDVPAPFSYEVSFEFSENSQLDFQMKYSDREDLTEDEIFNEGFSLEDDFNWKGDLDAVWLDQVNSLLNTTEKRPNLRDQEIIIKNKEDEFAPKNYKEWNLLIQDLIQAVFETSGKEQAWQMDLAIIKNGKKATQQMNVLFAKRAVDFAFGSNIKMEWNQAKKFMEMIYLGEFDESKAGTQQPNNEGIYLCFDQLTWYKLGHSISNPNGNKKYLPKLEFELGNLV